MLPERPRTVVMVFGSAFWHGHFCRGISCFSWLEKCLGTWISNTTNYSGGLGLCLWLFQNGVILTFDLQNLTLCKSCPHYIGQSGIMGKAVFLIPEDFSLFNLICDTTQISFSSDCRPVSPCCLGGSWQELFGFLFYFVHPLLSHWIVMPE